MLNVEKVQIRKKEVPFIGHVAIEVDAIREMPQQKDSTPVQHILSLIQYLN